jgi:uncharacterized membrane protein (UPF0127 family)
MTKKTIKTTLEFISHNILHLLLLTIICIVPLYGCSLQKKLMTQTLTIIRTDTTTVTVNAEIARTSAEQENGFMNRKDIPIGTGMLFIYTKDVHLSFWMKNTPHPLSIAYIDSKGIIKEIHDMTPFSLNPIVANFAGRYALEVPQGWFKDNNITLNAKLDLNTLKNK